jgi:MFS family permease
MCYSGFSASFITALYTAYIGKQWVGLTLVAYGVVEVFGSLIGGRISDRIGRSPVFLASCVCTLTGVIVASVSPQSVATLQEGAWKYFVAYIFLGLGDSGFNTQVQAALGSFNKKTSQPAFAAYRFILSVTSMIGAISGSYINLTYLNNPWQILLPCTVLWCVLFVSVLCWIYLDLRVQSVSDPKDTTVQ